MAKKRRQNDLKAVKAARNRKRSRKRQRRRALIVVFELLILLALIGVAVVMAKFSKFQKVDIEKKDIEVNEGIELSGYTTLALFGGDSREGELGPGTRTDTIIIVAINNDTKVIRMMSIYRDTLLQMEDGSYNKANHAYYNGGPQEAISMLNRNLDLDIKDYVTVDFGAMSDAIDQMGGLEIEVTDAEAKMMNKYVHETAKAANKKKEAIELDHGGTYTLNGPQAVTYARLRKLEGGDYKRTERQRIVINKMFEKAKTMKMKDINKMIDTVFPQISTSIDLSYGVKLASAFMEYSLGESAGFPFEKTDGIMYSNRGDCVVAYGLAENVQELHQFLYPDLSGGTDESGQTDSNATEDGLAAENGTTGQSESASDTSESTTGTSDSTTMESVGFQVSSTVRMISDAIAQQTGVIRPQYMQWSWLEEQQKKQEEQGESTAGETTDTQSQEDTTGEDFYQ